MAHPNIRLLVTDLDGTVMGHRDDRDVYPAFKALIDSLRRDRGLQWILATGRHYSAFRSYTRSLDRAGIYPDMVVTASGRVFRNDGRGYHFMPCCTARVVLVSALGQLKARRKLKHMHRHLIRHSRGVRRILRLPNRFVLRFPTDEAADDAVRWVEQRIESLPTLKLARIDRDLDVAHLTSNKGFVVHVLSNWLGIARDEILAIGDSSSDRSMLDRRVARHTGCPLNADEQARRMVHEEGGHLSTEFTLAGVLDTIKATLDGTVSSEMPSIPADAMPRRRRSHAHRSPSRTHDQKRLRNNRILAGAIVVITIVVFANYGLIPGAGLIMKPFDLLFRMLFRICALFGGF